MTKGQEGIVLYRGEAPNAIGFDIHGGYGETWTVDREHALCYARGPEGVLKQALLPPDAKRLVLVDPTGDQDAADYCWEAVDVLARLTDNPYLSKTLQAGHMLYDIWRDKWTLAVKEAGYDSIATHGIEGPEEYVLNMTRLVLITSLTGVEEQPVTRPHLH